MDKRLTARGVCKDLSVTPYQVKCNGLTFRFSSRKKADMFVSRRITNISKAKVLLDELSYLSGVYYKIDSLCEDVSKQTYKNMEHK